MPPRDLWDINPVYRQDFFSGYLHFFVSNEDVLGYPFHLVEESTMSDEEYNEHIAIPSAFDVEEEDILVVHGIGYYTDEEMVFVSDADDDSTCHSDDGSVIDMTLEELDAVLGAFIVPGVGMVRGNGTLEDPYDLTNA